MSERHADDDVARRAAILVADDYPANLTALVALLEPLGTEVVTASSGQEALAQIARRELAVVVLDVKMPDIGGLEVARRIRSFERNSAVPIIFLTALDEDAAAALDGYAAGAVDYVRKPFEPITLRSKIATFVELHERREQARRETELRMRLEAERAAAARESRDKDEFLSVLTHELRTPLTSILLWTEMLLNRDLTADAVERGHRTIDRCARAETHIVQNVLEMSRLATGAFTIEPQPIDILPVVDAAIEEVRTIHESGPVPVTPPAEDEVLVDGDRDRLLQLLFNLLDNAVKFTSGPAGGAVSAFIIVEPARVAIRIEDTGPGIPAEVKDRLFQRFRPGDSTSTRPHTGLGLGLAVAHAIAAAHGGALTVADRDDRARGTIVTLTLPRT
jgi:signal transduction histidine kinase